MTGSGVTQGIRGLRRRRRWLPRVQERLQTRLRSRSVRSWTVRWLRRPSAAASLAADRSASFARVTSRASFSAWEEAGTANDGAVQRRIRRYHDASAFDPCSKYYQHMTSSTFDGVAEIQESGEQTRAHLVKPRRFDVPILKQLRFEQSGRRYEGPLKVDYQRGVPLN